MKSEDDGIFCVQADSFISSLSTMNF